MYTEHKTAGRVLGVAAPKDIDERERADYEVALAKVEKYSRGNPVADARPLVDGQPYALALFAGLTHVPEVGDKLSSVLGAIVRVEELPGHVLQVDHELTYFVLGFDSGYWAFHAGHTPNAISAGVRIEALEALADDRLDRLTEDERQQVEFIRAVRDGGMTDDIWARMVSRLGSVRGAIEFSALVCTLFIVHRLMWAFGTPAILAEEWRVVLGEYKDGRRDTRDATQDYVWPVLQRARSRRSS